jgi:hypothetical protein
VDVQDNFGFILEKRKQEGAKVKIVCFYEQLPTFKSVVVPKQSAIIPGEPSYLTTKWAMIYHPVQDNF